MTPKVRQTNVRQMKLVAQYRQFAEECRKLAFTIEKREGKQTLQSMARAWERVANERERQLLKQIDINSGFEVRPDKSLSSLAHL
jgi:hypothetical protein